MVEIDHIVMWCRGGSHGPIEFAPSLLLQIGASRPLALGEKYMFRSS